MLEGVELPAGVTELITKRDGELAGRALARCTRGRNEKTYLTTGLTDVCARKRESQRGSK